MLPSLAELRTEEQIEADAEIERTSLDESDELVRKLQDAVAATATFIDYWYQRNNLPHPPSPYAIVMELLGRDLVHERTMEVVSHQVIQAKRSRKLELSVLATESQLALL